MTRWGLVVLGSALAATSCEKSSTATHAAAAKANDALWDLAPTGSFGGAVVSPGAAAMLDHGWADVLGFMRAAPELAPVVAKLETEMADKLGTRSPQLADLGLTADKGAAMFFVDDEAIVIAPVADRAKFRTAFHLTEKDGNDIGRKVTCKPVASKDVYACAKRVELLDKLGGGGAALRSKLDKMDRGDLELVIIDKPVPVVATIELSRGAAIVRGEVGGVPPQVAAAFANAAEKPRADPSHTSGFVLIPAASLAAIMPPLPLAPGMTLKDLMSAFEGPITINIPAGELAVDLRADLAKPDMIRPMVEHCDTLGLAKIGATVKDGTCHVPIPTTQLAVEIWLDHKTLRVATSKSIPDGKSIAMSDVGAEIAKGKWAFAFWGHGAFTGPRIMPDLPQGLPLTEVKYGIRAMSMLSEMGMAVRIEDGKAKFIGTVRTAFSNPDDVVAKLAKLDPLDMLVGKSTAQLEQIAKDAPKSPFARDVESGPGGMIGEVSVVGILSAVAIPAFMDYMKKAKRTEADLVLHKLTNLVKMKYIETSALPIAEVGPSGPSCCESPTGKCDPAVVWKDPLWKDLDAVMTEPTMFRYSYHSSDGKTAHLEAVGDLDCDGIEVTYKQDLHVDPALGAVVVDPLQTPTNPD